MTPQLEEIIKVRKKARKPGCDFIFHNDGHAIRDYRKCWHTVCVMIGLGKFHCRGCRDQNHNFVEVLDAEKKCPKCEKKWEVPKYIGKLFHDFRRMAAHELWKAGEDTAEDCRRNRSRDPGNVQEICRPLHRRRKAGASAGSAGAKRRCGEKRNWITALCRPHCANRVGPLFGRHGQYTDNLSKRKGSQFSGSL